MIGRLHGTLIAKAPPQLLLDVGGVGYELEAPMSTFYRLPDTGQAVTLHTHLTVRDDAHLLFGFATVAERSLFRELIKVSAVGPKLALAVLSGLSVEEFWVAVRAADSARFARLPGIGKKTAERLVVELKDRAGTPAGPATAAGVPGASGPLAEARAALTALGYKPGEVERLLGAVEAEGMTTEALIQSALKRAVR